jgi:hypothetical protein
MSYPPKTLSRSYASASAEDVMAKAEAPSKPMTVVILDMLNQIGKDLRETNGSLNEINSRLFNEGCAGEDPAEKLASPGLENRIMTYLADLQELARETRWKSTTLNERL